MKRGFSFVKKGIKSCRKCKELFGFEPKPVVWGNENAKIVQISQAPSKSASDSGRPFTKGSSSDKSGEILIHEWYGIDKETFYDENVFYITAIGHCYPGKDKNGDRKPPKICADTWLKKELKYLQPELYIVIGRYAAGYLFPKKNFNDLVFSDQKLNNRLAMVLPHPSPANKKWFKDNPEFLTKRLPEIRKHVNKIVSKQKLFKD